MQQYKVVLESLVVAVVLTAVSYIIGLSAGWITDAPWLEIAGVFTSYSCTYLCVKESRWNFPFGIISVTLFGVIFYHAELYASMVLSLYLVPVLIAGWLTWHSMAERLVVTRINHKTLFFIAALTVITYLIVTGIVEFIGGKMSAFDSAILVLSILAQYLLSCKAIENWVVWAVVNVIAIYTYFTAETYLIALQYVFFLANTVYGYQCWKRSMSHA